MNIFELIKKRRSIRDYIDKKVPREIIESIIKAGIWAPSACNVQGWHFLVIDEEKRLKELTNSGIVRLKDIPVGIFILYDKRLVNEEYQDHFQSGAAAIQNMSLATAELGLGSCWICNLPKKKKLKKLLSVPWYLEPIALFSLGYPKKYPAIIARDKDLKDFISYNELNIEREVTNEIGIGFIRKLINNRFIRRVLNFIPISRRKAFKNKLNISKKIK
jgi:nitroreductase